MDIESIAGKQKQRRSTAVERADLIERFRNSGLTRKSFSHAYGIATSTLSKWLTDAKRKSSPSVPVVFKELRVREVSAASSDAWAVEIVGPDGVLVRCRESLPLQDLSWLLRGR